MKKKIKMETTVLYFVKYNSKYMYQVWVERKFPEQSLKQMSSRSVDDSFISHSKLTLID